MICARACPVKAIKFIPWEKAQIDNETCVRCGTCRNICPQKAVEVEKIFNENNIS
jgi:NADH-quinone oxidoreductase subunit F